MTKLSTPLSPIDGNLAHAQDRAALQKLASARLVFARHNFQHCPNLDLKMLGGIYDPKSNICKLRYVRVGTSVGF